MKFNTYLFDFDGTLVDSMPVFTKLMLKILDDNNIAYKSTISSEITPLGYRGVAKYFQNLGLCMEEDKIVDIMLKNAKHEYTYNIGPKPNVVETLKKLKESGASLNVLTASPHFALDICLKRIGILDLFDNVWSSDDFGTTKADENIYKMAGEKMGRAVGEVLFVDDNYGAVCTAKKAGMKVCGAYDMSSDAMKEKIKEAADYYIDDFSQLESI